MHTNSCVSSLCKHTFSVSLSLPPSPYTYTRGVRQTHTCVHKCSHTCVHKCSLFLPLSPSLSHAFSHFRILSLALALSRSLSQTRTPDTHARHARTHDSEAWGIDGVKSDCKQENKRKQDKKPKHCKQENKRTHEKNQRECQRKAEASPRTFGKMRVCCVCV
jgi:hypothetical protein